MITIRPPAPIRLQWVALFVENSNSYSFDNLQKELKVSEEMKWGLLANHLPHTVL